VIAAHLTCCFFSMLATTGKAFESCFNSAKQVKVRVSLTVNPPQPGEQDGNRVRVGPRPAMN
jgi:hypothetical protein